MKNLKPLIERKQYMQRLRDQQDQNFIKVVTELCRCGKSTLLARRYVDTPILPMQFVEWYGVMLSKSPNLLKMDSLAIYTLDEIRMSWIGCLKNRMKK